MNLNEKKLIGLFLAAALVLNPGCAKNNPDAYLDEDNDGYADVDGTPLGNSYFIGTDGHRRYYKQGYTSSGSIWSKFSSSISSKGGIGSSGGSLGG